MKAFVSSMISNLCYLESIFLASLLQMKMLPNVAKYMKQNLKLTIIMPF